MDILQKIYDVLNRNNYRQSDGRIVILLSKSDYSIFKTMDNRSNAKWLTLFMIDEPILVVEDSSITDPTYRPINDEEWLQYFASERDLLYLLIKGLSRQ